MNNQNSIQGLVKGISAILKVRRENAKLREQLTRSKLQFYSTSRRGNPTPVARLLDPDGKKAKRREREKIKDTAQGLLLAVESIIALPAAHFLSNPKNIKAAVFLAKSISQLFQFLNFYVGTTASALTGGFFKLLGGGSILERIVGGFQLLGGIFMYKGLTRLMDIHKVAKDIKNLKKNLPNIKNLIGGIFSRNTEQIKHALSKIYPKTFAIFKKGFASSFGRLLIRIFGKSGSKLAATLGKSLLRNILKPIAMSVRAVPLLGPIMAIPINMLLGDPIDKAVFKAAGAGLGAAAMGLIGSVVPGAGNIIGVVAGGILGDFLASWIYDATIAPLKKKLVPQLNTGGIAKGPETGYPVTLHGVEAVIPIKKFAEVVLEPYQTVASALIGSTLAVFRSFGPLGSFLHPYALRLFNPFIRIFGLKTYTFSSNIGRSAKALPREAEVSKAKSKVLGDKKNYSDTSRYDSNADGGNVDSNSPKGYNVNAKEYDPLLNLIGTVEAGRGGYEAMNPNTILSGAQKMTISEVADKATGAVGMWQHLPEHLRQRARDAGLDPDKDLFNAENQKKMAIVAIEERGLTLESIRKNPKEAMAVLAQIWAALPKDDSGLSHYDGPNNKAHVSPEKMYEVLKKLSRGGKVSYMDKIGDGAKNFVPPKKGLCVTAVLKTMEMNGVPNPEGTAADPANPRGLASQLIRNFGWSSMNLGGETITLNSPYGKVNVNAVNFSTWDAAVRANKVPSGSIVFSTRHKAWNVVNESSGHDAAIAKKGGRQLWAGEMFGPPSGAVGAAAYGRASKYIFALTHGKGKTYTGSDDPNESVAGSSTEKQSDPLMDGANALIDGAKFLYSLLHGGMPTSDKKESSDKENTKISVTSTPAADITPKPKMTASLPSMSTSYMTKKNTINVAAPDNIAIQNTQMIAINNSYGTIDIPDPFEDTTLMSYV